MGVFDRFFYLVLGLIQIRGYLQDKYLKLVIELFWLSSETYGSLFYNLRPLTGQDLNPWYDCVLFVLLVIIS